MRSSLLLKIEHSPLFFMASLAMHLLALALPLALLQIYDRILPAQAYGTALFLVLGVGVAILLEAVLRYGRQVLFAGLGARYEAQLTARAIERFYQADVQAVEVRGSAVWLEAFRAIGQLRDFWSGQAGVALYELPFVLIYLVLIAYVGGLWLALIPAGLFILAVLLAWYLNEPLARVAKGCSDKEVVRNDQAWSLFSALNYLKGSGSEGLAAAVWQRRNADVMAMQSELETRMGWVRENAVSFGQLATVLVVSLGAVSVIRGELTTGALAACTMLAGRSIGPAMATLGYWAQLQRMAAVQQRLSELLTLPSNELNSVDGEQYIPEGALVVEAPDLLAESLVIQPGEVVHLATGDPALTSHLLACVAGMVHDPAISVTVKGNPIAGFSQQAYGAHVMLVTRHLALVPGSILDNLTLYDARFNSAVGPLCEQLGLDTMFGRLRSGILTEVGPGTAEHLDEGLYQRIALIRALVRKPRVLLLDHAATGLDLDGQKRLATILTSLQGNTTVLIATYKEPLVSACQRAVLICGKRDRHV
jgi:ATP-binding cassette subfamily C protein LapB